jgi:hypothetical protein
LQTRRFELFCGSTTCAFSWQKKGYSNNHHTKYVPSQLLESSI